MADKRVLDYALARSSIAELFKDSEILFQQNKKPTVPAAFAAAVDSLFASGTQSFREVALGCGMVRLIDKGANLRLPYMNQGADAYNGRSFDEEVVNPLLHDRQVPASKGPYLATFRRSVRFEAATREGVKDKAAYDAFLEALTHFGATTDDKVIKDLLRYLLLGFIAMRDAAKIPLAQINRLNLDQYDALFAALLETPSGGLLPVLLTVSMFQTICECFGLDWIVEWQGINVADKASGVGGDVTIRTKEKLICAIEVTERPIDRSRVVSTFNTKISPNAIGDYMFVFTNAAPAPEARQLANQYFGQGHDVNFIEIRPWLVNNLATLGANCRAIFTKKFLELLASKEAPAALKVKWNDLVKRLFA